MKDYHINVFYSEDDEGYIADIPDLSQVWALRGAGTTTTRASPGTRPACGSSAPVRGVSCAHGSSAAASGGALRGLRCVTSGIPSGSSALAASGLRLRDGSLGVLC